tara:strand:- start:12 stop:1295 length:1284 start_codon:yes stop_codon:yes gene_type:complete
MEKSDYLFLSNQQKNLQANNPDGVRNWSGTVMLLRPKPFGVQSVNQVRAFNHKAFKVEGDEKKKRRSIVKKSKSAAAILGGDGEMDDILRMEAELAEERKISSFSPVKAYRRSMDRQMEKSMGFMEHPFYDPVARGKNAPAYSLSGRPKDIVQEEEELPEFVIERGPHGTWTRRRVGFLEVHEALKRLGTQPPAFTMRQRLPSEFDKRGNFGDSLGVAHKSWAVDPNAKYIKGFPFGLRHKHLDPKDFEGPGPTAYDATEAFNKLKNPGQNEKYKQVSLGGKLVDIVNKDILTFPGPCKYEQPPAIPLDPICKHGIKRSRCKVMRSDGKGKECPPNKYENIKGGYFSPKLVDLVNKDLLSFPGPNQYNTDHTISLESRWKKDPAYSFYGGYSKKFGTKKPNVSRRTNPDELLNEIMKDMKAKIGNAK